LTELADLTAGEHFLLSGLEVALHDKSAIIDQAVFMNNVEDLFVDIDKPRGY
jgi:hypothetical protein